MAARKDTGVVAGLAVLNALIILTNVGIISCIVDNILSDNIHKNSTPNAATTFLLIFSVSGVLIGATSAFLGLIHSVQRDHALRAVAFGLSFAATIFYVLSLGFGAKQTNLKGEGSLEKAVFALDVILVVTGSLYTILLFLGLTHDDSAGLGGAPAGMKATQFDAVKV
ncbi:hypothetical protein KFL_000180310 [Klebsormidium nitens]|uniref:AWPM-19-like family protein n=1 Tax=Klebsormidium nitens TaxID=105231 RepID=A0A1Y1HSF4_KLENI|nr:hypothetical protein KFL_000180310 [Klebsormidium nitens]|eukprot:GAQ78748.1 hypothetical protein KFL_000180310 [Klebsormidium nitens]